MSEISDWYRRLSDAFAAALRSPGVCGPEIEVGPDADVTKRMLAVHGRRAWSSRVTQGCRGR